MPGSPGVAAGGSCFVRLPAIAPVSRFSPAKPERCADPPKLTTVACIDLNSDLGEGFGVWRLGDDDALLGIVTSANVACGFHAGEPATMGRGGARAAERGVTIGAQVSYRDLPGFGRRFLDVDPVELADEVLYQI